MTERQAEDVIEEVVRRAEQRLAEHDMGAGLLPAPRHISLIGRDIEEILLLVRFNLDEIKDDWNNLVVAGRAIMEAGDTHRYALGDIAWIKITPRYGEGAIKAWADDIGIARSTAYQYRDVSRTFPLSIRTDILTECPVLTWSHFFQASRVVRGYLNSVGEDEDAPKLWTFDECDMDAAISFLYSANEFHWAARSKMKKEIDEYFSKPKQGAKLDEFIGDITAAAAYITQIMLGETGILPKDFTGHIRLSIHEIPAPTQDAIDPIDAIKAEMLAAGMDISAVEPIIRVEASEES